MHRSGEDVARGESLAQLTDIGTMEVRAFVPLKHLPRTVVGEPISVFTTDAVYEGRIRARASTIAVPRDALVLRHNGSFVFRINQENVAERIAVEIGDSAGALVAVIGPISAGDRVAIRSAENLHEGSDVRVLSNPESTLSSASSDS